MNDGSLTSFDTSAMRGYLRSDGRKGIRSYVLVVYLVECAHHVARRIASSFEEHVQLIGFPGCYPSDYAHRILKETCTHPNVGAVLLVSLGCEEFRRSTLRAAIAESGRPVELLVIQQCGGTAPTVERGRAFVTECLREIAQSRTVPISLADLVVATKCGGSDGLSGITINPAVGHAFDLLVEQDATVMFEETCELIGCEEPLSSRAVDRELSTEIIAAMEKAKTYYADLGHGSFGGGNIKYGLSTLEEKSLGAYAKSGTAPIRGLLKPGVRPPGPGLYLMDTVNDGGVRYGIPNINDTQTITEMVASGCHLIVFTTGAGSVVGQAVAPVIKGVSNTRVYERMIGDMDINAGTIADGTESIVSVGRRIVAAIIAAASGVPTKSEAQGHQEFVLAYKIYEPLGPSCLPV
jgi:altronate hydrolase